MRDIPVGNGSLLVTFDDKYQIRDIYFPHVGQENHTEGFPFRFGVWAEGKFSWVFSDDWTRSLEYLPETLVTSVHLENSELGLRIICNDTVASHDNVFLRRVRVTNLKEPAREVRIFLHHDFRLYENKVGDTAFYDPETGSLIHYKKHRYFLIKTEPQFDSFATGRKAFRDHEGTWRDAEDGELSGGAVTEGSVDSTLGVHLQISAYASEEFFYWIAAGTSYGEVTELNAHLLNERPQQYLEYTSNYWRSWVNKNDTEFDALPDEVVELYKRSLLITRTQIDNDGAIIAANDSDVTARATDHYSYLWTRDGAFVANALDLSGYSDLARRFYEFCGRIVHSKGYFVQKYNADGTVASGWHAAWNSGNKKPMVPIQEDETALVLWALWNHYDRYRDIEFAHRLYRKLVIPCADFMADFRDPDLKLPQPTWNLWEDRRGIHTFTCAAVVGGLRAAAGFATLFADFDKASKYAAALEEITEGMRTHLFDAKLGRFIRSLQFDHDDKYERDTTVDASLFGTFYFGAFAPGDEMVVRTMAAVAEKLSVAGGIARFENDGYMRTSADVVGNAWFICTLWLAEFLVASATCISDLEKALAIFRQVALLARPSGVLSEQIDPATGAQASVAPLTWSHSTYVAAVQNYLRKRRELKT
ncbi:MAG TPA: glycoside hydrolase family 15 protein [Pyrinomonadaceae bacterium]|nr:glycoside hydrolase family 15 protein [Pyrinomonadaceae bacterium]